MTLRGAVIQAHLELGKSREEAELKAKLSDGFIPDAGRKRLAGLKGT